MEAEADDEFRGFARSYFVDDSDSDAVEPAHREPLMNHVKKVAERNKREIHDEYDTLGIADWAHTSTYVKMLIRVYQHDPRHIPYIMQRVEEQLEKEGGGVFDTLVSYCKTVTDCEDPENYAKSMRIIVELPEQMAEHAEMMGEEFPQLLQIDHGVHYRTVLEAIDKLYRTDVGASLAFCAKACTVLRRMDRTGLTPENLLLEYIHDQKSAHAVGKVIDKTKYGQQYAQKCGGFY